MSRSYLVRWLGRLRPMPRARVSRRGGVGYPAKYRAHVAALREALAHLPAPRAGEVVRLRVSVFKAQSPTGRSYGDADNLLKTVMDALPFDDALVCEVSLVKRRHVLDFLLLEVDYVTERG